jgi:hypothetical protein
MRPVLPRRSGVSLRSPVPALPRHATIVVANPHPCCSWWAAFHGQLDCQGAGIWVPRGANRLVEIHAKSKGHEVARQPWIPGNPDVDWLRKVASKAHLDPPGTAAHGNGARCDSHFVSLVHHRGTGRLAIDLQGKGAGGQECPTTGQQQTTQDWRNPAAHGCQAPFGVGSCPWCPETTPNEICCELAIPITCLTELAVPAGTRWGGDPVRRCRSSTLARWSC